MPIRTICRGALAIAATAILTSGFPSEWAVKQITQFRYLLANEMLAATGAGALPLEILVNLRKIRDRSSRYREKLYPRLDTTVTRKALQAFAKMHRYDPKFLRGV